MKRSIAILALALAASAFASAAGIDLGSFPLGSWLDANYQAVWEFSSGNIRILSPGGELVYDFGAATVEDFKIGLEGGAPTLSFSCKETGKLYKFTKPLASGDLVLEIDPPWKVYYKVTMAKR